jgi:hypothetical protein
MSDEELEDWILEDWLEGPLDKRMSVVYMGATSLPDGERLVRIQDSIHQYEYEPPNAALCVTYYAILKRTRKGVWIGGHHKPKFVLTTGGFGRRYAYLSIKDALRSYEIRKGWQKHHGEWTVRKAEIGLKMVGIYRKKLEHAKNGLGPDV